MNDHKLVAYGPEDDDPFCKFCGLAHDDPAFREPCKMTHRCACGAAFSTADALGEHEERMGTVGP